MMDTLLSPCRRRLLGVFGGLGTLALAGCGERSLAPRGAGAPAQFGGETMGTTYLVKLAGAAPSAARLERLASDVQSALDGVDRGMSLYRPGSELVRLNRHPEAVPLALSVELYEVLAAGQRVAELSQGAFDVSVAPLVDAWGFGPQKRRELPAAGEVQARRAAVDYRSLRLDPQHRTATKAHGGLQADLGGIAKGYGVDRAARAIEAAGIGDYMIEVGGEVRTLGRNAAGQPWQIGIEEPDAVPQRARRVVPLAGRAMATSGDYRIYFEHGGRRYSHEIDPRTAAPIAHGLASVTVVADDCMAADALATALIVLGPEAGWAMAQRQRLAAYFIVRDAGGVLHDRATEAFDALALAA
jgi:thiamine biosynthesis lipoprotein